MNKFIVTYEDNTQFAGDPFKSEWMKIDSTKIIIKFEYVLNNLYIAMEGYKSYNHLIEYIALGNKGIHKIFLMGRTEGDTEVIVLDIKNNKIYKDFKPCYREYGQQILNGWQEGKLTTPKSLFKRLPNVQ